MGTPVAVCGLASFSVGGAGFFTMFPTPGRSERPDLVGVDGCGVLGASVGMLEVGRTGVVTSSLPVLFGLYSAVPYALLGPGEFSFLNDEGSLDRSGSLVGDVCLRLSPREEDGVEGKGELGRDLSRLAPLGGGARRVAVGEIGCFSGNSISFKSESELRLFFLGGPVGMKLGCSPMVERPS